MARSFITAATVSLCGVSPLLDTGVVPTFFTPTAALRQPVRPVSVAPPRRRPRRVNDVP